MRKEPSGDKAEGERGGPEGDALQEAWVHHHQPREVHYRLARAGCLGGTEKRKVLVPWRQLLMVGMKKSKES